MVETLEMGRIFRGEVPLLVVGGTGIGDRKPLLVRLQPVRSKLSHLVSLLSTTSPSMTTTKTHLRISAGPRSQTVVTRDKRATVQQHPPSLTQVPSATKTAHGWE